MRCSAVAQPYGYGICQTGFDDGVWVKNRAQAFECTIAGKTVGVTLRHGGGLQEPEGVYVRCDERDCQYVDLNEAPCPLRIDMFADGSDRRVAEHVAGHAGTRFCYGCLTEVLGVTHEQVRRASWRLKDVQGFAIKPSRCAECRRRRVTIGISSEGAPAVMEVAAAAPADSLAATPVAIGAGLTAPLSAYLLSHPSFAFCAHCLARELGISPAVARDAMWSLESTETANVRTGQCVSCLLTKRVIRYDPSSHDNEAPRRIIELLVKSAGTPWCASCVAFAADVALPDARRILGYLEPLTEFTRATTACSACGRWQPVITAVIADDADGDAERAAVLTTAISGQRRHRGYRIALLSFRTAEGWKPFALVNTAAGALVADGPPFVLAAVPSKVEADALAESQARAWIDKRFP